MILTPLKSATEMRREAQKFGISTITLQEGSNKIDPINDFAERKNVGIITGVNSGIIILCVSSDCGPIWSTITNGVINPNTPQMMVSKMKTKTQESSCEYRYIFRYEDNIKPMKRIEYFAQVYDIKIINGGDPVVYPGSYIESQIYDWVFDGSWVKITKMPAHIKEFFDTYGRSD